MMMGYYPNTMLEHLFVTQDRLRFGQSQSGGSRSVVSEPPYRKQHGWSLEKEEEFSSRSVSSAVSGRLSSTHESLVQSLPLSNSGVTYKMYKPSGNDSIKEQSESELTRSFQLSQKYGHNISNPDLKKTRQMEKTTGIKDNQESLSVKQSKSRTSKKNKQKSTKNKSQVQSNHCNCGKYHSHVFESASLDHCFLLSQSVSMSEPERPRRSADIETANNNHTTICNMFWKAALTFSPYKHGNKVIDFSSLWPSDKQVKEEVHYGILETGLREAIWELCLLSLVGGPLSILKSLLDLEYIRVDYQYENDAGFLHMACLIQNVEAVQFLTQTGISPKIKDRSGKIAGEMCFSSRIRKQLPARYQPSILTDRNKAHTPLKPGLHDKDVLFKLAASPKHFYEVQKKLQVFDFNVNTESNEDGDFLIHMVCKAGICQLPLIMTLCKLHNANIEMCNSSGLTPLMIVAQDGDSNLCDILMCLFGANPNKQNERNGKTALHYAVQANNVSVVNCLLKRGADVNIDDKELCRPDDLSPFTLGGDDCKQILLLQRSQRTQKLKEIVLEDTVYPVDLRATDMRVVDTDEDTLIMIAAKHGRVHNLEILLSVSSETIDVQNCKTGLTALAMAAKVGYAKAAKILLRFGANPNIADMKGYLALHQAVLKNHESTVEAMLEYFPASYVGLHTALRLCSKNTIHDRLTAAWERRQREIIVPQLRMCSLNGDAERLYNILEQGDNVNCKSDLNEELALFIALENSHLDVVKILVEKGADLRRRDGRTGNTVLHLVAKTGHMETAMYMLELCCPQSSLARKPQVDINAVNNDRKTALQIAAGKGYIRLISPLIHRGATTAVLNTQGVLFTSPEFEGARMQIETHRFQHTKDIMKLVINKSKKALIALTKLWLPRFDHNLRDKNGDTPLMVACKHGRLQMVQYLLQSAVYANSLSGEDSDNNSDADSGVPEINPWKSKDEHAISMNAEELMKSGEEPDYLPLGASWDGTRSLNPSASQNKETKNLGTFLMDVERPKGLYIYHDVIVSHVCAVNLFDGNTPLHRTIEGGDNPAISHALLQTDSAVINMQNDAGLTPVHLACKLGRKKILQQLLSVEGLDLNLFTLTGHLAEEMTKNKSIITMVKKVRQDMPDRPPAQVPSSSVVKDQTDWSESLPSNFSSVRASTINFDYVQSVYQSMRHAQSRPAAPSTGMDEAQSSRDRLGTDASLRVPDYNQSVHQSMRQSTQVPSPYSMDEAVPGTDGHVTDASQYWPDYNMTTSTSRSQTPMLYYQNRT